MMDTFATPYPMTSCSDCVFTAPGSYATLRGGGFADFLGTHWKTSTRNTDHCGKGGCDSRVGLRCARALPGEAPRQRRTSSGPFAWV
jgi:hypothetical protein